MENNDLLPQGIKETEILEKYIKKTAKIIFIIEHLDFQALSFQERNKTKSYYFTFYKIFFFFQPSSYITRFICK